MTINTSLLTSSNAIITNVHSQATANCSDAKEYLEMMCRELTAELAHFDLRKEHELKQVFQEFAAAQLEKHEKVNHHYHEKESVCDYALSLPPSLCLSPSLHLSLSLSPSVYLPLPPSIQYQGKWYAMRCILDAPINPILRAIQFVSDQSTTGEF